MISSRVGGTLGTYGVGRLVTFAEIGVGRRMKGLWVHSYDFPLCIGPPIYFSLGCLYRFCRVKTYFSA